MRAVVPVLLALLCGCAVQTQDTRVFMGTDFTVTVIHPDSAADAIDFAYSEIAGIEQLMSTYDNNSQISVLNRNGVLKNPDPLVVGVIEKSDKFSEMSGGAFDITVQPLLELYSKSFRTTGTAPDEDDLLQAMKLVGYRKIRISSGEIGLEPGMEVTLGAIAKGFALDQAGRALKGAGIKNALINGGGDILAIGSNNRRPWTLALENPREKGNYITVIGIRDMAVATSGDYERYFDENMTVHHIMDPRTGKSATELISATVIAGDATTADALATAVFVLGRKSGLALLENLPGAEGLLITADRQIYRSSGFGAFET